MLITVIGRGHSGTRAISHTLSQSGVFMGDNLNRSGDLLPPEALYEACSIFGHHVTHRGGMDWDFQAVYEKPIDPAFTRLVETYLSSVLSSDAEYKGWKLPETTLILPWIVRMFPEARYIYWYRDPRDSILGDHLTDDLQRFSIPHDQTNDIRQCRIISWQYQYEIMKRTPAPQHRIEVRFENFVLHQDHTLERIGDFLGLEMAKIPIRPESVGRWLFLPDPEAASMFPPETLFDLNPYLDEVVSP